MSLAKRSKETGARRGSERLGSVVHDPIMLSSAVSGTPGALEIVSASGPTRTIGSDFDNGQFLVQHQPISSAKIILELGDVLWDGITDCDVTN